MTHSLNFRKYHARRLSLCELRLNATEVIMSDEMTTQEIRGAETTYETTKPILSKVREATETMLEFSMFAKKKISHLFVSVSRIV